MKNRTLLFLSMLFVSSFLFAAGNRSGQQALTGNYTGKIMMNVADTAKLSIKSNAVNAGTNVYTYTISQLNEDVIKTLDVIKNSHKAGASVSYEFSSFEVDQTEKTVTIGIATGILTQEKLMEYLQRFLDNAAK